MSKKHAALVTLDGKVFVNTIPHMIVIIIVCFGQKREAALDKPTKVSVNLELCDDILEQTGIFQMILFL